MGTTNPTIHTVGIGGLRGRDVFNLGLLSGAEVALDIRPSKHADAEEWISRYLRWYRDGVQTPVATVHHLPDLHDWPNQKELTRRAAATLRKYGGLLIVCTCPAATCARGPLAERLTYFLDDVEVVDLDPYRPEPADVPEPDMDPYHVERWLSRRADLERRMAHPALVAERQRVIEGLDRSTIYTVSCESESLRKRSASGQYRGTDKGKLLLLDANGRLQRMPIDRITAIRADFNPFAEVAA